MPHLEHRAIEDALDALPAPHNPSFRAALAGVFESVAAHYAAEEESFPGPRFAKMRAQHRDVLELGGEALRSFDAGQSEDASRLVRRFLALARHNMIEEERDVFPYYHQE